MIALCIGAGCSYGASEEQCCPQCGATMTEIPLPTGEEISRIVKASFAQHGQTSAVAAFSLVSLQSNAELQEYLALASECVADAIMLVFACEIERRRRMI